MAILQTGARVIPGIQDVIETLERELTWGRWDVNRTWIYGVQLDGAARDPGNPNGDTVLRPGLAMGWLTATKKATNWTYDAAGADLLGFLLYAETPQAHGVNVDKWFGYVLVGGQVRPKDLIFGRGSTGTSDDYGNLVGDLNEAAIRAAVGDRFTMDDFMDSFGT